MNSVNVLNSLHIWDNSENGQTAEIDLVRDEVSFDTAMAFVLEVALVDRKVGYIRLPRFYGGEDACAAHVLEHIKALKKSDIEGIVFDGLNKLPMEFAVEAQKLLEISLEGSVG